jgi:chromosome segregation ATPase
MIRHFGFACVAASLGLTLACNKGSEIEAETRDLAEAQNNTGNVAKDLEARLQEAKAEVIELEKKLALARQGITDDVLRERTELQGALDSQRREVQEEVTEARREAQVLNKDSDRATQQLQQTQPPAEVDTRLTTETDVKQGTQQQVESPARNELIPVRGQLEQQQSPAAGEVKSTTSTTRSAPTQPAAPDAPARNDAPTP